MKNNLKRILALSMAVVLVMTCMNLLSFSAKAATKSISLNHAKYTLEKGKTVTLKVNTTPKNKTVVWKSSNKSIATVSKNGVVKGIKNGKTVITATIKGTKTKASCTVNVVTTGNPKAVSLNYTEYTLKKGKTVRLKASISPKNAANKTIIWTSSKKSVATVSKNGVVKGIKNGKATITATVKGTKVKASCRLSVGTPVSKVSVKQSKVSLLVGQKATISTVISPSKATNKTVSYQTSNAKVATVSSKGVISAKMAGTANITVKAKDGSGKKAIVKVVVKNTVPTGQPTAKPTEQPTAKPTEQPTAKPTVKPTAAPTEKPTAAPTEQPTAAPTEKPTAAPTEQPTAAPTEKPTAAPTTKPTPTPIPTPVPTPAEPVYESLLNQLKATQVPETLVYETEEKEEFTIPEGTYETTTLYIKAPNATITNQAKFKSVVIEDISKDTWIEKATGNTIDLIAKDVHIIAAGKDTKIQVNPGVEKVRLEGQTNTDQTVPIKVTAENVVINTSVNVNVETDKKMTLQITNGAENSTVTIADSQAVPVIQGVGIIPVTNKETGELTEIMAENIAIDGEPVSGQTGEITGTVYKENRTPVSNAAVYAIPYTTQFDKDDMQSAIEAAEKQEKCYVTQTKEDGVYTLTNLPYGNYVLIVKADGLQSYFQTTAFASETFHNSDVTLTNATEGKGNVQGVLVDAFDAATVPEGIDLYLRNGADNTFGEAAAHTKTDANGAYCFKDLPAGTYTIQAIDYRTGDKTYIRASFNVVVLANVTVSHNMTLSQKLSGEQVRFVLQWGAEADDVSPDLDSHLVGPGAMGENKFHTYYLQKAYDVDGKLLASLDVDDMEYEGPETTTVYNPQDGMYHFYVYDYHNESYEDSTFLSTSQAVVTVYIGDRKEAVYNVPNGVGILWDVCTYDAKTKTLTAINTISGFLGESEAVGIDGVDMYKSQLASLISQFAAKDFGPDVAEAMKAKITKAKEVLKAQATEDDVLAAIAELEDYFSTLVSSTRVDYLMKDGFKRDCDIYLQGTFDQNIGNKGRLQGYSVIRVKGVASSDAEALTVGCTASATYEWQESDKSEFQKLLVVKNETEKTTEKYYVHFES